METYWLATGRSPLKTVKEFREMAQTEYGSSTPVPVKNIRNRKNSLALPSQAPTNLIRQSAHSLGQRESSIDLSVSGDRRTSLGMLNTKLHGGGSAHTASSIATHPKPHVAVDSQKTARLVKWNSEGLARLLKLIVSRRNSVKERSSRVQLMTASFDADTRETERKKTRPFSEFSTSDASMANSISTSSDGEFNRTVLEEVQEIIHLPVWEDEVARHEEDPGQLQLDDAVRDQLVEFVTEIASMYR